jgi:hypothetical protein
MRNAPTVILAQSRVLWGPVAIVLAPRTGTNLGLALNGACQVGARAGGGCRLRRGGGGRVLTVHAQMLMILEVAVFSVMILNKNARLRDSVRKPGGALASFMCLALFILVG